MAQGTISIPDVRSAFTGRVIAPGDPEYDRARSVHDGSVDRRPAVIIRPADAAEVARVVALARETRLELAVRSGGHSGAGHSVTEGGIVLDLSDMRALDIDVEGRTAWAETGLTAGEYTNTVGAHGLVTGFGDTGSVGIGGLTLGGGIGFLVRKHGMTIDNLLAADVVTADGELLRADEDNHPDLFWAIRGGGGNFGVATRFRFRLRELPSIVGLSRMSSFQSFLAACAGSCGFSCWAACFCVVSFFLYVPVVIVWLWDGLLWPRDRS